MESRQPREKHTGNFLQDSMAVESHARALRAQKEDSFTEIIPVKTTVKTKDGEEKEIVVSKDEGPRAGSTMENLARLRTVFKKDGTTTAGNASQVSDGAAAVLGKRLHYFLSMKVGVLCVAKGCDLTCS